MSVVVPAFDAERWIDRTLQSIRSQTHRNLEVIVVDDGSRDGTAAIAARHAVRDARVRVVRQANAGVAAARNRGLGEARGRYVAPVDADDLCARERIAKLVAALEAAGPMAAVAYGWSAFIDEQGRVLDCSFQPRFEGDVRAALCATNFVANGSAAMIRTDALRAVGGFDPSLRARGAQGCEDWSALLRLAEHHRFVLVPEFLTGYRQSAANMSSDCLRMYRSFKLVAREHAARFPHSREPLEQGRRNMLAWLIDLAGRNRDHRTVAHLASRLGVTSPGWAYRIVAPHYLGRRRTGEAPGGSDGAAAPLAIGAHFPFDVPGDGLAAAIGARPTVAM